MRELQALVAPKPPQGILVRGQAGLLINNQKYGREEHGERAPEGARVVEPHHPPPARSGQISYQNQYDP